MAPRMRTHTLTLWRIGDPEGRWPIYSPDGARRHDGRWHRKGQDIIYTSANYSTALLEKLVHYNGVRPPNQHYIKIQVTAATSRETVSADSLPGWDDHLQQVSRDFGSTWITQCRSAILIVPSVPSLEEKNVLINPAHPDSAAIKPGSPVPVQWDSRLFPPDLATQR